MTSGRRRGDAAEGSSLSRWPAEAETPPVTLLTLLIEEHFHITLSCARIVAA
jgi:hypothetical protein